MLTLASGVAIAVLVPEAPPSRSVTYGLDIPGTTDNRLGRRLAIVAIALVTSALLLVASRRARESS
jgi:hypothetical protein